MAAPKLPPRPGKSKAAAGSQEPPTGTGTTGTSDTPPKTRAAGSGQQAPRRPAAGSLQRSLEELFSAPAMAYALSGDQWAMEFVNERAPIMAEAWTDLARQNPAVKRILERLTQGSAWGGVMIATGGTILPLLAHHNVLPAPVQAVFGDVGQGERRGPIVPPPPAPPAGSAPPGPAGPPPRGGGGAMTPPMANGQPPGVVTVAGSNSRAVN